MTETSRTEFRIPESNLGKLQDQIAKLARKAEKLSLPAPRLETIGHEDFVLAYLQGIEGKAEFKTEADARENKQFRGLAGIRRYLLIRLVGEAPAIPGYKLVAVVEHGSTEVGNIIRGVPGETCPAEYRHASGHCDHCKTTRRRNETFIIRKA